MDICRTGRVLNILYLIQEGLLNLTILYLSRHVIAHKADYYRLLLSVTRELVDVIFEQPYCRISNLVDKGISKRQGTSRYLHDLTDIGVLHEMPFGKEKLLIHPKLMQLISRDNNQFQPYA